MEKDSPVKPSVAELAGKFKGYALPMPMSNEERGPVKRKPPCSLDLHKKEDNDEPERPAILSPLKTRMKNSPLIEKLQANLALSPTSLLPSPRSPEVKLQPTPQPPTEPCSPLGPCPPLTLPPPRQPSEEEEPISFEKPAEGSTLPSINKSRARLSFKRRPPTRQHRRSGGEEGGVASGAGMSPSDPDGLVENGDEVQVFDSPMEAPEQGQRSSSPSSAAPRELEPKTRDCKAAEDKAAENTTSNGAHSASPDGPTPMEQEVEQAQGQNPTEEQDQPMECSPAGPPEGSSDLQVRQVSLEEEGK